jgi:hypothetical protein
VAELWGNGTWSWKMTWKLDQMGKKSPFKYVFYDGDPSAVIFRDVTKREFFLALQETVSATPYFTQVAVFLGDDLVAIGDVESSLRDAVRTTAKNDFRNAPYAEEAATTSKCACYVVWAYYCSSSPRVETVIRQAEANILNHFKLKELVS